MGTQIYYAPLPSKGNNCQYYHPRNVMARLKAKLKAFDPIIDDFYFKSEIKSFLPAISWASFEKTYLEIQKRWKQLKGTGCKHKCTGPSPYSRPTAFSRLADKLIPDPKLTPDPNILQLVNKHKIRFSQGLDGLKVHQTGNPHILDIEFKRRHPAMSYKVEKSNNLLKVTVKHYSKKTTILYIDPKALKVVKKLVPKQNTIKSISRGVPC